ncbi:hypothetical protein A6V39_03550 [Candidatus Mycoplasma haematobovis]|uniref:Uncharacterized protein n=1 Tax=Candidatus Mycoplasma haematobovis TaxID=432608 RepID=A0A1A9QD75_9MOLU|nr:hypothetical protein [Candidatus Mycoplasma haematobovis]OAL09961.1 hypothetical protein A6V39_03550 [Candidatus Mycoplasma haematobovis]
MLAKVIAGIAGTSIATTAGIVSYFYLTSGYTIKDLLSKEKTKKEALNKDTTDKTGWLPKWKEYSKIPSTNAWNVSNWDKIKSAQDKVPDEFAEECGKRINNKVKSSEDQEYKNFINWCTK